MSTDVRDSFAKVPLEKHDSQTRSKILAETNNYSYLMKTFEKRLNKAPDESTKYKLKKLVAYQMSHYYDKNISTKQSRKKYEKPDYLYIYKDRRPPSPTHIKALQ